MDRSVDVGSIHKLGAGSEATVIEIGALVASIHRQQDHTTTRLS